MGVDLVGWSESDGARNRDALRAVSELQALPLFAAMATQRATRERLSRHPSWRRLSGAVEARPQGVGAALVGYARRGQGRLGHIAEFGSARKRPHPALIPALEQGEKDFHRMSEAILGRLL